MKGFMKKKILAISICVCICFALLAIPAFATSSPETTAAPNVFDTLLQTGSGGYTLTVTNSVFYNDATRAPLVAWLIAVGATSDATAVGSFSGLILQDGASGAQFSSGALYTDGSVVKVTPKVGGLSTCHSVTSGSASISSSAGYTEAQAINNVSVSELAPGGGLVPQFADEVFSVGGSLISFVMSHWIVLIPVVAFLVILCIGAIRKLIKGE